jgi:chromosome segregation ATPase
MSTEIESLIREMDETLEGMTSGSRELDLQMIEFLINLDERVAALLKSQSDRVERKLFDELHDRAKELSYENRDLGSALAEREARITELLERCDGLRLQLSERDDEIKGVADEREEWRLAFLHVRDQILSLAKEQGTGNARIREHLKVAQTSLDTEEVAPEGPEISLGWSPSSERISMDEKDLDIDLDDDLQANFEADLGDEFSEFGLTAEELDRVTMPDAAEEESDAAKPQA